MPPVAPVAISTPRLVRSVTRGSLTSDEDDSFLGHGRHFGLRGVFVSVE
jgi:hypothetical protein